MTDLLLSSSPSMRFGRAKRRLALLWGLVVVAAFVGIAAGMHRAANTASMESALVLLLRFMALCKAAVALAAALLVTWRLRHPLSTGRFAAYVAALVPMAAAPGLIFALGLVAPGALVFHAGFLAFLLLAARDDAIGAGLSGARRRRR